jgi:TolB-like protein/tetratricopeptide (TPR) repeat protein
MRYLIEAARSKGLDRIGIAYAVFAWVVVQAAAIAAPAYAWPPWVLQLIILVALLGLPVVLIGAWAQGIRASTGGALRPSRADWHVLATLSIGALVLGGIVLWTFWPRANITLVPKQSVPALPAEASIAVLPFVNMSGDPKKEYFSDGFSEELINDLANVPRLNVVSRTSSFAFKDKNENIKTIARALDVHAVVEGSVREAGDRVRITAQLINASDGYHLWSADYTRNLTDILSVQDEVARTIAAVLTHRLVPATPRPRIDPAVYRQFLEGIHQFYGPAPAGWHNALATFEQVTLRAPDFADGFAWLSNTAMVLAYNSDAAPASDFAFASAAAQRALSLDPHNQRARFDREVVELGTWRWQAAASDIRVLIGQNPNGVYSLLGLWNYYAGLGFPERALAAWQRMRTFQPEYYRNDLVTVWALDETGRFQDLITVAQAQLVRNPRDTYRLAFLCSADAATGQIAQAQSLGERLRSLQNDSDSIFYFQDCRFYIAVAAGDRPEALRLLQMWESEFPEKGLYGPNLTGISAGAFGATHVLLADYDKANTWFERAYERREPALFPYFCLRGFGYEAALEKYRQTPGYKAFAAKPLFREWQAEHDRIAAALAAHRDPLN